MEDFSTSEYIIDIIDYVPASIARRIIILTQTRDALTAVKRLCDLGLVEYAVYIISQLLQSNIKTGPVIATPFPLKEIPVKCTTVMDEDIIYIVMATMLPGHPETKTLYCYALDIEMDQAGNRLYYIRACSDSEYTYVYGLIKNIFASKSLIDSSKALANISLPEPTMVEEVSLEPSENDVDVEENIGKRRRRTGARNI